jgi:hypothetical protein
MPPSVCCAKRAELHSAAAATNASSRGNRQENDLMEYLKEDGLGNRSSREGFLKSQKTLSWVVALKFWVPLKIGKSEAASINRGASFQVRCDLRYSDRIIATK